MGACRLAAITIFKKIGSFDTDATFDPVFADALTGAIGEMNALGVKPTITKGFRTAAEQQALRKNPGNYPVAKGASWHQAAQAVDFDHYDRNFPIIHAIMAKHGFVWGGGYGDPVHFQLAPKGTNPDSSLLDKVGGN